MPTLIPEEHWTSQGRTQLYAEEMVHLQEQLIHWTSTLKLRPRETELFVELAPDCHHSELQEDLLLHDDALLPLWKDFAEAVSHINASAHQCFLVIIQDVQLAKPVIDLLAPALNQAPIGGLLMRNNRMPREGIRFVSRFVELNPSLKCLAACNKLETEQDAVALAQAVRQHPNIESLILHDVGLGRSPAVSRLSCLLFTTIHWKQFPSATTNSVRMEQICFPISWQPTQLSRRCISTRTC